METLGFVVVRRIKDDPRLKDLKIRKWKVIRAIEWLTANNQVYKYVTRNAEAVKEMDNLPEDQIMTSKYYQEIIEEEEKNEPKEEQKDNEVIPKRKSKKRSFLES